MGMLGQLATWMVEGALVDRDGTLDYSMALRSARVPLWLGVGAGDTWCPPEAVLPLRELWGGDEIELGWFPDDHGHLDVVVHPDAPRTIVRPLVQWSERLRDRAWGEVPTGLSPALRPRRLG